MGSLLLWFEISFIVGYKLQIIGIQPGNVESSMLCFDYDDSW